MFTVDTTVKVSTTRLVPFILKKDWTKERRGLFSTV